MVFAVVMYGCESWTVKKAECRRIDAFELWGWRRVLRVPSINGAEKVKTVICKRMKFDHTWYLMAKSWTQLSDVTSPHLWYLIPYTKIDSKWIKYVRSETLKLLGKNHT